jgi:hypothetical protein
MFLDSLKKTIINQLIAADDGYMLHDPLEPYFRAFAGAFDPDMPFTFYSWKGFNTPPLWGVKLGVRGICSPAYAKISR